jgi:ATP-dependent Clp protease ATP-binding subunit ClpC
MPNKMERFTQRVRRVLSLAQEEAERLQHNYIAPQHILLGLMREDGGVASRVLRDLGVDQRRVEELVERMTPERHRVPNARPDLSADTKKVIELAVAEARRMGHHFIGTEHLLLGLLRQNKSAAIDVLKRLNVNPEEVRRETQRVLQESPKATNRPPNARVDSSPLKVGFIRSGVVRPAPTANFPINTPLLDTLAEDLSTLAKEGKLDPVIGREAEITRIAEVLSRRENNGALLVGAPGVGKTAIIRGLVQRISDKTALPWLHDKRVLFLDSSALVAGTFYRGQFEERLRRIIVEAHPQSIFLFIDHTQTLLNLGAEADVIHREERGEGSSEGRGLRAADISKPALEDAMIRLIGAMTPENYSQLEKLDPVLARRFQIIRVNEPSIEETIEIGRALKSKYEAHHQVKISDDAISAAVRLSVRHLPERSLPGKAISLIDEAASRAHLHRSEDTEPQVVAQHIAEVVALWTGKALTEISDTDEHS